MKTLRQKSRSRSRFRAFWYVGLCFILCTGTTLVIADSQGGDEETVTVADETESRATGNVVHWSAIAGGATKAGAGNFRISGTVGQGAVGVTMVAHTETRVGYWQDFPCCRLRGDINHDGSRDIGDITGFVGWAFRQGPPLPCPEEADVNDDGEINIADLTYLVNWFFKGGPEPPPC